MQDQPSPLPSLSREQFEMALRRAGLALPQAEYDNLFEGARYIEALLRRNQSGRADRIGPVA